MSPQRQTWIIYCLWISSIVPEFQSQSITITAQSPKHLNLTEGDSATLTCSFNVVGTNRGLVLLVWLREKRPEEYGNFSGVRILAILKEVKYRISSVYHLNRNINYTRETNGRQYTFHHMPDRNMSSMLIEDINVNDEGSYFCYILSRFTAPVRDHWDEFTLEIIVPPAEAYIELNVGDDKGWLQENSSATFTCTIPRVKPNVTAMEITLGGQTLKGTMTETSNGDRTHSNSYTVTTIVRRTDNGEKMTCKVTWNDTIYTRETRSLRVVSKVEHPKSVSVNPGPESCQVEWDEDQNAKTVFVCYSATSGDCNEVTAEEACTSMTGRSELTIERLQTGAKYCIWLYASNELGKSGQNSTKMPCTPTDTTTAAPTLTDSPQTDNNIGLIAGLLSLGFVVLIVVSFIIGFVIGRKRGMTEQLIMFSSDENEVRNAPANQAPARANQDNESPSAAASDRQVQAVDPEMLGELQDDNAYERMHMENVEPRNAEYAQLKKKKRKK